jgi:transcriptional regulator with XRE-family HTH domain
MIAENIKKRRKELGLSQEALGARVLVHQTVIAKIEAGVRSPSLMPLALIGEALGCTPNYLYFGSEKQ